MSRDTITKAIKGIDARTWAKIEKRARREGKSPEEVAAFLLDRANRT